METNKKRRWLIEGSTIYSLHHSKTFKKGVPEMCNEFYFNIQPDYGRDITKEMAEQQAKEIHTAINGYDSLLGENKRLKDALNNILKSFELNKAFNTTLNKQEIDAGISIMERTLNHSTVKEVGNNG